MKKYLLIFVFIISCNSEKIALRKDAAALNRVETNVKLLTSAYVRALKLYPCVNDSITINKTDTFITQTVRTEIRKDTINKKDTIVNFIEKTFHVRDSIRTVVKDQQGLNALNDSLIDYRLRLAVSNGSLQESRVTAQELNNKIAKTKTALYVLLVAFFLSLAAFAYFKFIPKI